MAAAAHAAVGAAVQLPDSMGEWAKRSKSSRSTPGSAATETYDGRDAQDKVCAYSASDNYVVTDACGWQGQEFTHVSGSLGGGVGYMCSGTDCNTQVRVEGTGPVGQWGEKVTLNSGDAVFCST